jgi:hypothetical protein
MSEDIITTHPDELKDLMESNQEIKSGLNVEELKSQIRQFATLKEQSDLLAKRMSEVKSYLTAAVENFGETDGRGHINLEVGDESVGIAGLQLQRRSTPQENMEAIERILKTKRDANNQPLWAQCIKMVPVVQEDEVMKASFDGLLTEDDISEMYPRKVTYAFFPQKA